MPLYSFGAYQRRERARDGHSDVTRKFRCNVGNDLKANFKFRERKRFTFTEIRIGGYHTDMGYLFAGKSHPGQRPGPRLGLGDWVRVRIRVVGQRVRVRILELSILARPLAWIVGLDDCSPYLHGLSTLDAVMLMCPLYAVTWKPKINITCVVSIMKPFVWQLEVMRRN